MRVHQASSSSQTTQGGVPSSTCKRECPFAPKSCNGGASLGAANGVQRSSAFRVVVSRNRSGTLLLVRCLLRRRGRATDACESGKATVPCSVIAERRSDGVIRARAKHRARNARSKRGCPRTCTSVVLATSSWAGPLSVNARDVQPSTDAWRPLREPRPLLVDAAPPSLPAGTADERHVAVALVPTGRARAIAFVAIRSRLMRRPV